MARISRRLSRLVPSLILLAGLAGHATAVEPVVMNSERATFNATLALDEFQAYDQRGAVAGIVPLVGRIGANRVQIAGRAQLERTARDLLGQGLASKVLPVLWANGRVGDPDSRIEVERQILIEPAAGIALDAVMQAHGLIKAAPIVFRPGWWMVEPANPALLAPIDALKALQADPRIALAYPNVHMPTRLFIDDPMLRNDQPGPIPGPYPWHLVPTAGNAASSLNIGGVNGNDAGTVWAQYALWQATGIKANIMIVDSGVQSSHPDLSVRTGLSGTFVPASAPGGEPATQYSNHGTFVAGLAAAVGNNEIGTAGVAYGANIISRSWLKEGLLPRDGDSGSVLDLSNAWILNSTSSSQSELVTAINNSWGPALRYSPIDPLNLATLNTLLTSGNKRRGTMVVFAAGNDGSNNTNDPQAGTAFNGNNNRYTITVGALTIGGGKADYSETGPNLTVSAPGGGGGVGMVSTDLTDPVTYAADARAARGYVAWSPVDQDPTAALPGFNASDFNGDGNVTGDDEDPDATPPTFDGLPYENGAYTPAQAGLQGTSFAAPLVTGMVTVMAQSRSSLTARDIRAILIHRGQGYQPAAGGNGGIHGVWDDWVANVKGLEYNNWYGFGRIVAGPLINGGTGAATLVDTAGAGFPLDEPGCLRWPLLPPEEANAIVTQGGRYMDTTGPRFGLDVAILDAPGAAGTDNVPDGPVNRDPPLADLASRKADYDFIVDDTRVQDRFRIEAVELTVNMVGTSDNDANKADYSFELVSPDGAVCSLGRQSSYDELIYFTNPHPYAVNKDAAWSWTFTELFHYLHPAFMDTTEAGRTWRLRVLDERAGGTCRIDSATLRFYGHQTYPVPALTAAKAANLPSGSISVAVPVGLPSGGERTVDLTTPATPFSFSATNILMTQAYWDEDGRTGPILPVQLATAATSTGVRVTIPATLLPTTSPGQGSIYIGNPALVDGRNGAIDRFETPNTVVSPAPANTGLAKHMKLCDPTEDRVIRYSRPPTVSPISDIRLTGPGAFVVNGIVITDPDVVAGLPTGTPETLTTDGQSFNTFFAPNAQLVLTPTGGNTYRLDGNVTASSGFALIQVTASDGVTKTVSAFRVIIPSNGDGSGCGGGMGLALLTIPLAAWFIRRRKRD